MEDGQPTVAELVDRLFADRRHPDGRPYSYLDVAIASGGSLRPQHVQKLRTGRIRDPRRSTIEALCRFFGVSPLYFFPSYPPRREDTEGR